MSRNEAARLTGDAYNAVERGDFKTARSLLEKALKLADDIPDTHSEYGFVLSAFNEYSKAREHFMRAIQISPSNPKFWVNLGRWYFDQRKCSEALTCILHAEKLDSSYPTIEVAKMHITKAMGATPDVIEVHRQKALELYKNRGRRADGSPLQPGDIERILPTNFSRTRSVPHSAKNSGCGVLILLMLGCILFVLFSIM